MTPRRKLSTKQRIQVFQQGGGRCYLCKQPITPRDTWQIEHSTPFAIGGSDDIKDLLPVHDFCHAEKTKADVTAIAKTKRIFAKHIGAQKPTSRPRPGRWDATTGGEPRRICVPYVGCRSNGPAG